MRTPGRAGRRGAAGRGSAALLCRPWSRAQEPHPAVRGPRGPSPPLPRPREASGPAPCPAPPLPPPPQRAASPGSRHHAWLFLCPSFPPPSPLPAVWQPKPPQTHQTARERADGGKGTDAHTQPPCLHGDDQRESWAQAYVPGPGVAATNRHTRGLPTTQICPLPALEAESETHGPAELRPSEASRGRSFPPLPPWLALGFVGCILPTAARPRPVAPLRCVT